jgi:hypothetical protein
MFQSGYGAIKEQLEKSNNSSSTQRLANIYWGKDETKTIRHLHDDPFVVGTHQYILGRDGKRRTFICRESLIMIGVNGELTDGGQDCPLCKVVITDEKNGEHPQWASKKGIGLVALRQSTHGLNISDVMTEAKGDQPSLPTIGVIQQAVSNFWNGFMAYYMRYGTTTSRDYEVSKMGEKKSISFTPIPCDPIAGLETSEEVLAHYGEALGGQSPRPILAQWINGLGSERYYKRYLPADVLSLSGWSPSDKSTDDSPESLQDHPGGVEEFAPSTAASPPQSLSSLRDSLTKYRKDS